MFLLEVRIGPLDEWARKIRRAKQLKTYKMLRTLFSVKLLKSIVGSLCQYDNEMTMKEACVSQVGAYGVRNIVGLER